MKVCWRQSICVLVAGLGVAASLAPANPTQVLLEIKSKGGYRDARAPEPFILLRVLTDGQVACHCDDYRWVESHITDERVEELQQAIVESGFLELSGGASKVKSWWRGRFMDFPTVEYRAHVGDKKQLYRRGSPQEPEPEALRELRQLAEPLREELCRSGGETVEGNP